MSKKSVRVAVTGAAGQIGYALLFRLASGDVFGPDTDVHLNLLELTQALPALEGVKMELEDCAFPTLASMILTDDVNVAFKDVDWALLVGSVPRKQGMERKDLLTINGGIFTKQGQALDQYAAPNCKVLVVGNPCNTNALIAKSICKRLPAKNFFAMTMLDQNRAYSQLAVKAGVHNTAVKNVAIWGNHSATQYPDLFQAEVDGSKVWPRINDQAWLEGEFIPTVQKRGAAIIEARGLSSAASAANAAIEHVRDWVQGTPEGDWVSMGIPSDGSYGIPEGVIYGYPVTCKNGAYQIVKGIELSEFSRARMQATHQELLEERDAIRHLLG